MKSFYEWKQEMLCRYDTMPAFWWQAGVPEKMYDDYVQKYTDFHNRFSQGVRKC